ncbi:Hint domain-containing protein [Sorangium sp. So ce1182]|uniref:Hint domain-containing protein n=1 Tax=Sorangium sp. So ce1182 TaxID=3133334 RepID=UPI003F5E3102
MRTHAHIALALTAYLGTAAPALANDIPDAVNRINSNAPEAARCKPMPKEECASKLERALERSCINWIEHETLKAQDDTPLCDYEVTDPMGRLIGWCPCSCFAADTQILSLNTTHNEASYTSVEVLHDMWRDRRAASLADDATLNDTTLVYRPIVKVTKGPEEEPLVQLQAANGSLLKLTRNHTLLLGTGMMVKAIDAKEGDELVKVDGTAVPVISVSRVPTSDLVYNFLVQGNSLSSHTLVAEGFVVGDLAWENSLATESGQIAVRR